MNMRYSVNKENISEARLYHLIQRMLDPKTVALIGATEKEGTVGRAAMENLLLSKERKVFPVNPKRRTVLGVDCFPTVTAIPKEIDLVMIATPARTVPGIVEECGKAGAKGVIIVSAGFKEVGKEGKKLEHRIREIKKQYRMRIIGPNCLGVIRPNNSLNASFLKASPEPGNIAFISQSGALGSGILDWAMNTHIGFSMFASLGSTIDVDFGDLIDFLGDDPETKSIMMYMEGVGNAKKLMSAARGFARSKPIIVIKPGRFPESVQAALSHTGSMAGDDQVYDAAFRRAGVVRVHEISELFNAAEVLDSRNLPKGPRVAIITNAGGPGVMATDTLLESGGKLARLSDESIVELNSLLPTFWSKSNPIDLLGDADIDRYLNAMTVCQKDSGVDGILCIYTPQGAATPDELAQAISEKADRLCKPTITAWIGGKRLEEGRQIFLQNNIPSYETPEEAVKTYVCMYNYSRNLELLYETPAELPVDQAPPKNNLKAIIQKSVKAGRAVLSEEESKKFLFNYGIPVAKPMVARNADAALRMAREIEYPVVLKIVSPDISHKTDVGGVSVGIDSDQKLKEEFDKIIQSARAHVDKDRIQGISVQKMLRKIDYEIILGTKKDKDFGSLILFGMGGVEAEIFRDFSIGLPPLNQTLARRLMEETKVYRILQGYRGRPPADMRQLEQILVSFSNLIVDFPEIAEMDVNPLAISGGQACALDARIVLDSDVLEGTSPRPDLVITPYPTRYVIPWKLVDGTPVILRPIKPEDEPLEYEMLTTLSKETLRQRFFQVIKEIPHEMLVRFCNIDYDREMAIVAEVEEGEQRRIIGIGRLIIEADLKSAEFAVVVHDDYQGRRLGYKLLDTLIGIAQEKNLDKIYGVILNENKRMLQVCEELGFTKKPLEQGLVQAELALA